MCTLGRAIAAAFRPRKLNYELLGNQVPHLHWHLIPRYESDPNHLRAAWVDVARAETDPALRQRLMTGPLSRAETAERLRQQLAGARP